MTRLNTLSRRSFLLGSAAALGAMSVAGATHSAMAADNLTVGFIYVGPKDDFGYNQAHA